MNTIVQRVLARRDLDAMRAAIDLDGLTAALNAECQLVDFPQQITALDILDLAPNSQVLFNLLREAASGVSIAAKAAALLSPEGLTVIYPGYVPEQVSRLEVSEQMYFPDGRERTE